MPEGLYEDALIELEGVLMCIFESQGNATEDAKLWSEQIVEDAIVMDGEIIFSLCSSPSVEPYCIDCVRGAPTRWFGEYQLGKSLSLNKPREDENVVRRN